MLAAIWPSKDAPLTLTMDRAELLEAARRVKAVKFSGGETVTLALAVGDDSITLGLDDAESGSGARQTVSAEVSGPVVDGHVEGAGRRLRLDARYVANACGALYGDRVTMYVAPRSNGRYKPVLARMARTRGRIRHARRAADRADPPVTHGAGI